MNVIASNNCVDQSRQKPAAKGLLAYLATMLTVRQQRKALKDLDEHLLRDIGITRQDAEIEAEKPVWDVPRHWSR